MSGLPSGVKSMRFQYGHTVSTWFVNRFGSPEMENLTVLFPEHMHHWPLHVIGIAWVFFVIGLKWRVTAGAPTESATNRVAWPTHNFLDGGFGNSDKSGVVRNRIPGAIKPIHQRRAGRTRMVPVRAEHP